MSNRACTKIVLMLTSSASANFWDRRKQQWSRTACETLTVGGITVRMSTAASRLVLIFREEIAP